MLEFCIYAMGKAFSNVSLLLARSLSFGRVLIALCAASVLGVLYFTALVFTPNISILHLPLCPETPPGTKGIIEPSLTALPDEHIAAANPEVQLGGHYQPTDCEARSRVAIVVAYRDRAQHLQMFLNNLHPVLQRQQLDYTIFIVEQAGKGVFNKGILYNVGYVEANAVGSFQCFVFHDVDVYPENDRNSYSCRETPTLLVAAMNKYSYHPLRERFAIYFGAVISLSTKHFADVNGYPNLYWGWGGEDDDMGYRVQHKFGNISFSPLDIGRYTMASHGPDEGNPINPQRFQLVNTGHKRFFTDGLSSLNYTLVAKERRPLYTWFLVDVGQPPTAPKQYRK